MAFSLGAATTIQTVANSRRITGTGNLSDLYTALSGIASPFVCSLNGSVLSMSGGGTAIIIVMNGTLVEQRSGNYSILVSNKVHLCWGDSTGSPTTTAGGTYSAGATSITVASATDIIVGSFLVFTGITTAGDNGSRYYRVTSVAGTTIGLATGLASTVSSGSTITLAGSSTLGLVTGGLKVSQVDISYAADALATWSYCTDPASNNNAELCAVGIGALRFLCGSFTASHSARFDLDWYKTSHVWLDWVNVNQMEALAAYQHFFYGNFYTSANTSISKNNALGGAVLESGGSTPILNIPSFACNANLGMGFTSIPTNAVCTVTKPQYWTLGFLTPGTGISCKMYDPAYLYFAPTASLWTNTSIVYEIFRTFNVSWVTPAGANVGSAGVPAKLIALGGSAGPSTLSTQNIVSTPASQTFTGASTTQILRQSYKNASTAYTFDGVSTQTGFSDDASYNIYLVSYGNAYQTLAASAKPAVSAVTIAGIPISGVSPISALAAAVAYASVVTAPFSMNTGTNTLTISANCTMDQIGQYLMKHCYDNASIAFYTGLNHNIASSSGASLVTSVNIAVNTAVSVSAGTVTQLLTTTGTVTLTGTALIAGAYTDSTGVHAPVVVVGLVSGSRIQIYNVTDAVEVYNGVVGSTSYFQFYAYTANKTFRLRVAYASGATAYLPYETTGILTATGASFVVVQALDVVYNTNAISGSTCTEFASDLSGHIYINVTDSDNMTTVQRLYAWYGYNNMSSSGISTFFGGLFAQDTINYVVVTAVANIYLYNTKTVAVQISGANITRDDGVSIIASNYMQLQPGKAYLASADTILANTNLLVGMNANTGLIPALV